LPGMKHPDKVYFDKLKEEISARYRSKNPSVPARIEDWNGKTIEGFQNDLQQEVKSAISLRWFYMHIKSINEDKIPPDGCAEPIMPLCWICRLG
jgi:hypothetical protein